MKGHERRGPPLPVRQGSHPQRLSSPTTANASAPTAATPAARNRPPCWRDLFPIPLRCHRALRRARRRRWPRRHHHRQLHGEENVPTAPPRSSASPRTSTTVRPVSSRYLQSPSAWMVLDVWILKCVVVDAEPEESLLVIIGED